jgi:hypothetical protein
LNQYPDVKENAIIKRFKTRYERTLRHEESLHVFLHLLNAFLRGKSYSLGKLATHISGQKAGSKHQSTQTGLRRKLDIFQKYQLVIIEHVATSTHCKCYKITPTKRLHDLFSNIATS